MAEFKYEGDISDISSQQLQFFGEVLEKIGFNNNKVLIEVVGDPADNFSANVKRIVVENAGKGSFKMIAKFAPTQENVRFDNTSRLFMNESIMYTEVLPLFRELEDLSNVPESHKLKFAKCYGTFKEEPHEVILLEDLKLSGYSMLDKIKSLTDECMKSVLKDLAKLHSLSYVLKNADAIKFDQFKYKLFDVWENIETERLSYCNFVKEQAFAVLTDEKQKQVLAAFTNDDIDTVIKAVVQEYKNSKYSVILQGDPWTNNIMFKTSQSFLECIMIDYQVSRVHVPPADLMYLIFCCTDHSTRFKYFNTWIDYYHSELENSLRYHDLQVNSIYPKHQLYLDFKNYAKVAFNKSLIMANVTSLSSDEGLKVKEFLEKGDNLSKLALLDEFRNSNFFGTFKEKVQGLLDSFVHFGLL